MAKDSAIEDAIKVVRANPDAIGIALLQRHLLMGYNSALKLMNELTSMGIVTTDGAHAQGKNYLLCASDSADK